MRSGVAMTAIVAGVVVQKFVHLVARNADLMKMMRAVTDNTLLVVTVMAIVMLGVVITCMVTVMARG